MCSRSPSAVFSSIYENLLIRFIFVLIHFVSFHFIRWCESGQNVFFFYFVFVRRCTKYVWDQPLCLFKLKFVLLNCWKLIEINWRPLILLFHTPPLKLLIIIMDYNWGNQSNGMHCEEHHTENWLTLSNLIQNKTRNQSNFCINWKMRLTTVWLHLAPFGWYNALVLCPLPRASVTQHYTKIQFSYCSVI